jgi:hypothetical protein
MPEPEAQAAFDRCPLLTTDLQRCLTGSDMGIAFCDPAVAFGDPPIARRDLVFAFGNQGVAFRNPAIAFGDPPIALRHPSL